MLAVRRNLKRFAVVIALAACATGCTPWREYIRNGFKVGPNYGRPAAPVAYEWIDANDQRVRSQTDDLAAWWMVFNDPVLNQLTADAYAQNLTLREAGFRVLEARAHLGHAVGNIFPQQQDMTGGYTRYNFSAGTDNFQSVLPKRFFSQFDYGFGLAWELDFWGRFRRAIEAAEDELDASVEEYDDVLVTLLGDVAATYAEVRTLEQQIALARANVKIQEETLSIAKARFEGGQSSDLDVEQSTSILAQTQASVPQFEIALRRANNALCVLLGMPPQDLIARFGAAPIPVAPADVAVGIPADLLRRRPDVRRAERLAAAQCAQIGIAESEFYPHVSITGSLGYSASKFTNLFDSRSFQGMVGPQFQWNVLNYGRIRNNVLFEEAQFQEYVVKYQNTVLTAGQEAEDGIVEFLKSQETAMYLKESVKAAETSVQLAIVQYRGGLVDFNTVALLEQNLVQQQNLWAQAQGQIAQGLIQVYRALGGGWEIRLTPPAISPLPMVAPPAEGGPEYETMPVPDLFPAPGSDTLAPPAESSPSLPAPAATFKL